MNRRKFVQNSVLGASAMTVSSTTSFAKSSTASSTKAYDYRLKYAPHLGMFKNSAGKDPIDQLKFMADQGFRAFEDNGMKGRDVELQEKMAKTMQQLGMEMGVFVAHKIYWKEANLASGKEDKRAEFLEDIKSSIEVAKRVNAKWMTVVPGYVDLKLNPAYQTANVVESLKQASALLEPHGIVMVLEPLNFRNHPGMFLAESPHAYLVCKAVNSPSCKILFDIYHQQITEGNLIPNIEACWDEIGYFQIGDNPGRKEPTSGEINYKNIFKYIHERKFEGILGMEHGNAKEGKAGEMALIRAYQSVDQF
ncbi:MAG: TIM barrel protein [Bacteroidota bacterium]